MLRKNALQIPVIVAYLLFWIAAFFPEKLWGIHFLAFLPLPQKLLLLIVSGILIFFPKVVQGLSGLAALPFSKSGKLSITTILILGAGMLGLYILFPIFQDEYGDAYRFQSRLDTILKELPKGFVKDIFSMEFTPSTGRKTVLLTIGFLSHHLDATYKEVFKWVDAISGLGFVLLWTWFVRQRITSRAWQLVLVLLGILAPLTQVFYLHTEAYAPVFLLTLAWLVGYTYFFRSEKPVVLIILSATLLVLLKLHPVSWLLVGALVIGWLHLLNGKRSDQSKKKFNLRKVSRLMVGLVTVFGLIIYLVVLKDHIDPRHLNNIKDVDRLFLPILSPKAPLDRYNLFSLNHILDYFNAIMLWSMPMLVAMAALFASKPKDTEAAHPVVIGLFTVLILQCMLLFMINPLVTMPMDWDLFSFPAITMLVLLVILIAENEHLLNSLKLKGGLVGLTLLTAAFIPVNASSKALSYRLESLGRHIFKTYYLHSNRILISSVGIYGDMEDYMARKDKMEKDLRPYALVGNDKLYANLFMDDGFYYLNTAYDYDKAKDKLTTAQRYNPESPQIAELLGHATLFADANDPAKQQERYHRIEGFGLRLMREFRDFSKAQSHFQAAIKEYPDSTILTMFLMEARFQQQDFDGAYYNALTLLERSYPDKLKSLRIAIHCALEAGMYQEAYEHSIEYLKLNPDDKLISEVRMRLDKMDRPDELRLLFVRR